MSQLLDTGFLYALLNRKESRHADVMRASQTVRGKIFLPTVVTTEVAYLVQRDLGSEALAEFLEMLATETFVLVEPLPEDFSRAATVVRQYTDSQIDFVDAILVAIAERLNIKRVLTIDTRHFRMFRPKHCDAFQLLP
ncbi:MAG: PIN domain-containing protein [Ardenticatenaceae bacterium]|nr:PIN domain-containing protein [Ardenticatenaceae bacterium]